MGWVLFLRRPRLRQRPKGKKTDPVFDRLGNDIDLELGPGYLRFDFSGMVSQEASAHFYSDSALTPLSQFPLNSFDVDDPEADLGA